MADTKPTPESLRSMMSYAWQDHFHTRDQTWKAIQIEAILAAGLLGVDFKFGSEYEFVTVAVGILVMAAAYFGARISIHHRVVMVKNFDHILKCEEMLGLHDSVAKPNSLSSPSKLKFIHAFDPTKNNTATYILRMHVTLLIFAFIFVIIRLIPLIEKYPIKSWIGIIIASGIGLVYTLIGAGYNLGLKDGKNKTKKD